MADWLVISSANLDSFCGGTWLDDALGGDGIWYHLVKEIHWFIFDLEENYNITKFRSFSCTSRDPIDVDIYVSTDKENWGDPVASGISTWQDGYEYVEVDSSDKVGRFVKVVINETENGAPGYIQWGDIIPPGGIFDAYGELYTPPATGGNASFFGCNF